MENTKDCWFSATEGLDQEVGDLDSIKNEMKVAAGLLEVPEEDLVYTTWCDHPEAYKMLETTYARDRIDAGPGRELWIFTDYRDGKCKIMSVAFSSIGSDIAYARKGDF